MIISLLIIAQAGMLFNSVAFMIFLPIVFVLYWICPHKYRWVLLLISSYYFYMSWNAKYIIIILFTTGVSYIAALLIENQINRARKKIILSVAMAFCLGILFFFKYFDFFSESVTALLKCIAIPASPVLLKLVLPVGVSFYTFQTLSYIIDVYRGKVKAERHFGVYATFISFFPQLVAGPIERTENLLPQIKEKHVFNYDMAVYGLKLMLWGYFKKLVIADTIVQYVDPVFSMPSSHGGIDFIIAVFFFTIQIYCDFSGYSDIAIGTAKLLGINLMTNFKSPYFSTSIHEFWSRWHISLSTWFKDYIYIPLGGNRCSKSRHSINLLVTFWASGLWHGADWTFVIWGGQHGLMQVIENLFSKWIKPVRENKIGKILAWLCVFCFCNLAWVFFRATTISDALYIIGHMFIEPGNSVSCLYNDLGISKSRFIARFAIVLLMIIILAVYDFHNYKTDIINKIASKHIIFQWTFYILIGLMIALFSQKGVATEFVYFQF